MRWSRSGIVPSHATLEAKRRMGLTNKTDKLDARWLAILLRNGILPEVWIPPSELRDQRELLRLRIFLVRMRTRGKNRIQATLARYANVTNTWTKNARTSLVPSGKPSDNEMANSGCDWAVVGRCQA